MTMGISKEIPNKENNIELGKGIPNEKKQPRS